jgi:hypothetical protein
MGHGDDPVRRRMDRAACGRRDVQSEMRAARFAVQDTLAAIDATDAAASGPGKPPFVIDSLITPCPCRTHQGDFLLYSFSGFGVGRHGSWRQAVDAFDLVVARRNRQGQAFFFARRLADVQGAFPALIAPETDHEMTLR